MTEQMGRIRFTPSSSYLGNPHKGCCTFQRFNGDPLFPGVNYSEEGPLCFPLAAAAPVENYLPTTVAYCRWFWPVLEPAQGQYDFSMIDEALKTAGQRGQTLSVRLMAFGQGGQPGVPDWYTRQYPMTHGHKKGRDFPAPVQDASEYFDHFGGLIRQFAQRYDQHPLLESIDVAFVGPWGEGGGDCPCGIEQRRRFLSLWKEAFVHTPRLALIAETLLSEALTGGAGWRCDCFGDVRGYTTAGLDRDYPWNHTFDCHPKSLIKAGGQNAWQKAPIYFETCWVPLTWHQNGFNLDFIIERGLRAHGTYFMPKSTALPDEWLERLADFCRKLGYRFMLRQASFTAQVPRRGEIHFESWIENVGVAPIYRRYDVALRLRQGMRQAIVALKDTDIRTWLPGDVWLEQEVPVPDAFEPGPVELALGVVDVQTRQVRVRFEVVEQEKDGWVPLGKIEVI